MTGLAYLRHVEYVNNVGADITELWVKAPKSITSEESTYESGSKQPSKLIMNLIDEMFNLI